MGLLWVDVGVRTILVSGNTQNVMCNKEKDSIADIWPLRVFKSPDVPLILYPTCVQSERKLVFLSPLGIPWNFKPHETQVTGGHSNPCSTIKHNWKCKTTCLPLTLPLYSLCTPNLVSLMTEPEPFSWGILLLFTMWVIPLFYISWCLCVIPSIYIFLNKNGRIVQQSAEDAQ